MRTTDLNAHISATYATLRLTLVVIAVFLPLLLSVRGSWIAGQPLADSMSAYYWACDGAMRDWFVGSLFGAGALLFVYKGYTLLEDIALKLAGLMALGVALFPMTAPVEAGPRPTGDSHFSIHGVFAVSFFAFITYVCLFQASATLTLIHNERRRRRYNRAYKVLGAAMLASPFLAFIFTLLPWLSSSLIFFIEAFGVWVFAAYWALKSREIRETQADRKARTGKLRTTRPEKLADVFRQASVCSDDDGGAEGGKKYLAQLTPEELEQVLQSLPPERRLAGLTPEQRSAGLSADQIRQDRVRLTAGAPPPPRKPRRKK
jgi:hypothetical protein